MPESISPAVAPASGRGEMCADYSAAGFDADPNLPDTNGDRRCGRSRPAPQTGGKHSLFHAGVADAIGRQYGDQRRRDGLSGPLHAMGSAGARGPVESGRRRSLGMARPGNGASCRTRASRPQARTGGSAAEGSPHGKASRASRPRTPAFPGYMDSRFRGNDGRRESGVSPSDDVIPTEAGIHYGQRIPKLEKEDRPTGPRLRTRAIQPVPTSEPHPRYPTGSGDAPVRASAMETPAGGRPSRRSSRGGTP